ncbi:hypothetical protein [Flindersiella endophytica]
MDQRCERSTLLTGCGRRVDVGQFVIAEAAVGRVVLRLGPDQDGRQPAWVTFTAAEATRLASALLEQATAIRRTCPDRLETSPFSR